MPTKLLPLLALSCALSGCDLITDPICTLEARPAIAVVVRDSTTGGAVAGNLMLVATTGPFSDTLRVVSNSPFRESALGLAHERSGTYTVEVLADGYHPWSMNGVVVQRGECHVQTRTLDARLRPQS